MYLLWSFGFPDSSFGKESAYNARDPISIPGSERFGGEGIGYLLQYSWASLVAQTVKTLLQCWRPGFDLWVGKIPWRRERLPTPGFWLGELHGLYSPWGCKELDTTEWLSLTWKVKPEIGLQRSQFLKSLIYQAKQLRIYLLAVKII